MKGYFVVRLPTLIACALMSLSLGCASSSKLSSDAPDTEVTPGSTQEESLSDGAKEQLLREWQKLKPGLERLLSIEKELNTLLEQLVALQAETQRAGDKEAQRRPKQSKADLILADMAEDDSHLKTNNANQSKASQSSASQKTANALSSEEEKSTTQSVKQKIPPSKPATRSTAPRRDNARTISKKSLFSVQVASSQDYKNLAKIFRELIEKHPKLTQKLEPNFQIANVNKARYYRLKLGNYSSKAAASDKCQELMAVGVECIVSNYTRSDFSLILENRM